MKYIKKNYKQLRPTPILTYRMNLPLAYEWASMSSYSTLRNYTFVSANLCVQKAAKVENKQKQETPAPFRPCIYLSPLPGWTFTHIINHTKHTHNV